MQLLVDVALPALILVQLSRPDRLGPLNALLLAVGISLASALWALWRERRVRPATLLGLVSVLLLGLIALFELPAQWIAAKEALVPGGIALVLLVAHLLGRDLAARVLLLAVDVERVERALATQDARDAYRRLKRRAGLLVIASFVVSAIVNYAVASLIVVGQPGTAEFNEQIAATSVVSAIAAFASAGAMLLAAMWYFLARLQRLTGIPIGELIGQDT